MERSAPQDSKIRLPKVTGGHLLHSLIYSKFTYSQSEFYKSLASNLRNLRKVDLEKRILLFGPEPIDEDYTDGDDDEYLNRSTRGKRRKIG
jgi:hypothetical protein